MRPNVADDDCDMRYLKLMQSCWDENPLQRPTFEAVKAKLRQIHGGRLVLLKCHFRINDRRKMAFVLNFFACTVRCLLKSCTLFVQENHFISNVIFSIKQTKN